MREKLTINKEQLTIDKEVGVTGENEKKPDKGYFLVEFL
jgi:hypothetical protein